jgi:hypothetical protein
MDIGEFLRPWVIALRNTPMSWFIRIESWWVWPTLESLHFTGMSLLIGTIGAFDLRVLGVAKAIPPRALHRVIPFGIAGYLLNLITGTLFFIGNPDQYTYNSAFHFKLGFMALAGINLMLFYSTAFAELRELPAGADASPRAKLFTAISLGCWICVIICGRLLTFFRPSSIQG